MSLDVPTAGSKKAETKAERDWRKSLVEKATSAGEALSVKERVRNPMVPNNMFDFSAAGFPADIQVLPIQIPRPGDPAEMAQYKDMLYRTWQHLPYDVISTNGGLDGKAVVPGCEARDMGGGRLVAVLGEHYLMYANRHQHVQRRKENTEAGAERVRYKMETRAEEDGLRREGTDTGPMSIEELFEYEKSIGDEAPIKGGRLPSR